jgi:hypothetical protein
MQELKSNPATPGSGTWTMSAEKFPFPPNVVSISCPSVSGANTSGVVDENEKVADSDPAIKARQSEVNTRAFDGALAVSEAVLDTVWERAALDAAPLSRFVPPAIIENEYGARFCVVPSKAPAPVPVMVKSAGIGTPMPAQLFGTRKVNSTGSGEGVVPNVPLAAPLLSKKYGSPVTVGFTNPKRTAWLAIGCNENSAAAASPIRNFFISSPF